jgi:hypothetical protein
VSEWHLLNGDVVCAVFPFLPHHLFTFQLQEVVCLAKKNKRDLNKELAASSVTAVTSSWLSDK